MATRNNYSNTYNSNIYNSNNYSNATSSAYDYDYNYNQSTAAPLHEYEEYDNNTYDTYKAPQQKVIKRRKKTIQYNNLNHEMNFFSKESLIIISTIFIGSMVLLFGNSTTTSKKVDINNLRNELAVLTKSNETLKAEIDQSYDLNEIEYIATTQLGMSKPKSHQIVYINAEVDSYVKQYEDEKPSTVESSFFENFKASLISIFTFN